MNIAGIEIGASQPCRFVAEISNNHNGDLRRAKRLIVAAKEAGASFAKFQAFTVEELVALRGDGLAPEPWGGQGWTMRTLYQTAQTPLAWLPTLFEYAAHVGIPAFSSVFGPTSLAALEAVGNPCYKIAALDNEHDELRAAARETGKPVLVSVRSYDAMYKVHAQLLCPPGYPVRAEAVRLPRDFFKAGLWGLSSHCLAPELPIAAVARGCKLIEMHLMLAEEPSDLESNVSLNQYQYRAMIESARNAEAMLG